MKKKAFAKKHFFLILSIVAIVAIISWLTLGVTIQKPLGDKLEYIGKTDYGCWLVCDSNPASTYYYGTDMTIREVASYFKNSTIEDGENLNAEEDPSLPLSFSLKAPDGSVFYITYRNEGGQGYLRELRLPSTNKKHVIGISDSQYQAAKDSL